MVGTPKNPPSKHKTFGISDSLLDAVKEVYRPKDKEDAKEAYIRPGLKQRTRDQARKSETLKSKDSVSSAGTTAFKKKHAGKTVPKRAAGAPVPKSTGQAGDKRPVGGMGAVYHDLGNMPEDEFRRKHGKSKSAMRTGLRDHVEVQKEEKEMTFRQSDYEYNKDSWMKSLSQVGKDGVQEEEITEMNITVEMNPGGTTYKVLSVSKDVGGRIKVGENLTDTHIDDLRDSDVSISYKGGKDGKQMKKMEAKEAKDVDADSAASARKHDCASHVKSEEFGEGVCIPTQHADPDEEGQVEWYDVMFDHGIERVMTEKLNVVESSTHMHSSKTKKKKAIMGSKKLDPVGQADDDIDNDGDTDDSDEYLHSKRKAIKKAMKKESVNENFTAPGKEQPKDAAQAYALAEHYWQLSNRDALYGREDKQKVNEGFAKQFYDIYKQKVADGDESAVDTFKSEEVIAKLESFSESETTQTNESLVKFSPSMDKKLRDDERTQMKKQGTIKMRKTDKDGIHGTTVQQNDTAKIAALKAKGYIRVSEDNVQEDMPATSVGAKHKIKPSYNTDTHKLVKKKGRPGLKTVPKDTKLADDEYEAEAVQHEGFKQVEFEGQIIYELSDSTNMPEHAPEVVEMTPDVYQYNTNSWRNALAEVNRYKTGGTGHRVTQPDKSGDEHIVMQLRKAVSVGPNHQGVKFKDGSTHKVSPQTAQKHLDHYAKLKPEDKIKWQNSAAHSHGGLSAASTEKKMGQARPAASKGRDEPTRRLINPMDRD